MKPSAIHAPKVPRLPPITIKLTSDQELVISLPWLVSKLTSQLLFLPRNAAGQVVYDHVLRRHWSFYESANQDLVWRDVGGLREAIMTGIDLRPLSAEAIVRGAEKRTKIKPHMYKLFDVTRRWPGEGCLVAEDVQVTKQKIEDLKAEFEREYVGSEREIALYDAAQFEINWLVSVRLKAFLAQDVAAGLLERRGKEGVESVLLADLVRWAEHREIVIEKEVPAPTTLISLTGAGERRDHQAYDEKSTLKAWQIKDPRDPEPEGFQPWYTAARFFARQEISADPTLVGADLVTIAGEVQPLLAKVGYFKRNKAGAVLSTATIKKALIGVQLW